MLLCTNSNRFWCWRNSLLYFSFINKNVSSKQILLSHMVHYFSIQLFANGEISSKLLKSANNEVVHFARYAIQDLYNTDTSNINKSQSWSLPSVSFLSADLIGLICTWLIVSLESLPSQRRNTTQPQQLMLWTSQYFMNLLITSNHKRLQAKILMCQTEFTQRISKKTF